MNKYYRMSLGLGPKTPYLLAAAQPATIEEGKNGKASSFRFVSRVRASKAIVERIKSPISLAVVVPMYRERSRLLPATETNPNGEDALRTKMEELEWLFSGTNVSCQVYLVDDGCPEFSGKIAQSIIDHNQSTIKYSVIFLGEHLIDSKRKMLNLKTVDQSQKGGAVILGCLLALEEGHDLIAYSDCDTSVSLAQLGLLIGPGLHNCFSIVIGSRSHPDSYNDYSQGVDLPGYPLVRRIQKALCPALHDFNYMDTQSPFKIFRRLALERIIKHVDTYNFCFDIDLILGTISNGGAINCVPFDYVYSGMESNLRGSEMFRAYHHLLVDTVRNASKWGISFNDDLAKLLKSDLSSEVLGDIWSRGAEAINARGFELLSEIAVS